MDELGESLEEMLKSLQPLALIQEIELLSEDFRFKDDAARERLLFLDPAKD